MFVQRVENRLVAFLRSLLYGVAPVVVVHRDGKLRGRFCGQRGYAAHADRESAQRKRFGKCSSVHLLLKNGSRKGAKPQSRKGQPEFLSWRLCAFAGNYTVDVSRYSPQTRRSVLLISPTVAYDSTHARIRGIRFSVVAAARSSSRSASSNAFSSRRARNVLTRSTCACSKAGSIRNSCVGGSDSS